MSEIPGIGFSTDELLRTLVPGFIFSLPFLALMMVQVPDLTSRFSTFILLGATVLSFTIGETADILRHSLAPVPRNFRYFLYYENENKWMLSWTDRRLLWLMNCVNSLGIIPLDIDKQEEFGEPTIFVHSDTNFSSAFKQDFGFDVSSASPRDIYSCLRSHMDTATRGRTKRYYSATRALLNTQITVVLATIVLLFTGITWNYPSAVLLGSIMLLVALTLTSISILLVFTLGAQATDNLVTDYFVIRQSESRDPLD